jgi:hypothetical protein
VFNTLDTHKFFYGSDGKPISDIVSISLQPSNMNVPAGRETLSITDKEDEIIHPQQETASITPIADTNELPRDGTDLSPFIYSLGSDELSPYVQNDSSFTLGPDSINASPSSTHDKMDIHSLTDDEIFKLLLTPPHNS